MTPQHVISQLLASDSKKITNITLLKKIMLTAYLGRLQVNGQYPDNAVPFINYLFDNENTLFDFSRLSEEKQEQFKQWLLKDHDNNTEKAYFTKFSVNEYRGFTAERRLNWFKQILRWFQGDYTAQWKIAEIDLSLNYQLLSVDMKDGQKGMQIAFNQLLVPPPGTKYKALDDPEVEPLGNTKRVLITDSLVDQLINWDLNSQQYFETICKGPHPLSISVNDSEARHQEMHSYRSVNNYIPKKPWYLEYWDWFVSFFQTQEPEAEPKYKSKIEEKKINSLNLLHQDDSISIEQTQDNKIIIKEKKPNIDNVVLCGGGSRIYAHVGVWKALNELEVIPKKFAGSSAGAIMALACYLGYSPEYITEFLKHFKNENLIYFSLDSRGMSKPDALKTAFDFLICSKVKEITQRYTIPFPKGKITFKTLADLKAQFPDCGLGDELIVTGTNKNLRKTSYFSYDKTPDMEVSEAVKISASIPVIFRDTKGFSDGGILSNLPLEAYPSDNTSFLESEYANNMKTVAVQFDNGTERVAVDRIRARVHREHFLLNWVYGFLSGVSDPASGWEQDRLKLRKYAGQAIIVDVGNLSVTDFSVSDADQQRLINSGYATTKDYLDARYLKTEEGVYKNKEIMYTTFSSLEELLVYCCYRKDKKRFNITVKLIEDSSLGNKKILIEQANRLKDLYFSTPDLEVAKPESLKKATFFGNDLKVNPLKENNPLLEMFLVLYPIFIKLPLQFIKNKKEYDILDRARHSFTSTNLFRCMNIFNTIKDDTHIVFHIFLNLVKALQEEKKKPRSDSDKLKAIYKDLQTIQQLIYSNELSFEDHFYGQWNLNLRQGTRVLKDLSSKSTFINKLCNDLKQGQEPLQTFNGKEFKDSDEDVNLDYNAKSVKTRFLSLFSLTMPQCLLGKKHPIAQAEGKSNFVSMP